MAASTLYLVLILFRATGLFLYSLKTLENQTFSSVLGGIKETSDMKQVRKQSFRFFLENILSAL